jgi:cephalosporin hydroxylase
MILYQEIIMETQPDYIVEIGTQRGGSALFFQDMLDMCGSGGKVITIDVKNQVAKADDRIQYIIGNSKDSAVVEQVRSMIPGKVMVVIDGNHDRQHVKWDLKNYGTMVTSGQYLVVEDCYEPGGIYGPGEAKEWYLRNHPEFVQTDRCKRYHVGLAMDGWLLRK